MINVMARALMASVMTVAAALVADDCGKGSPPADGGGGDPRTAKTCDTRLEKPRAALRSQGLAIVAYSVSECDLAPQSHVVHLSIEHLTGSETGSERGDTWKAMPSYDGTAFRSCGTIPYPNHPVRCEWFVPCILAGMYQTRATVTGTSSQGIAFSFTVPEKPWAKITCGP